LDTSRDRLVRKGDYVYGSFIKPASVDGYINGMNPGDRDDDLGRFPFSEASVDDAVVHARKASEAWRVSPMRDRERAVLRFRETLIRLQERLARLVTRETGKPLWESRVEIYNTLRAVDVFLQEAGDRLSPRKLDPHVRSDRVPRGVVGVLCPYNLPVLTCTTRVVAAVLAGNAVVFKPSKFTPAVGQLLAEIWDRCKLPRGIVNMVQGSGSVVGKRLVGHPQVSSLLVASSFNTAMAIRRATFDRPELPVHYESGGKGVAMVLEDADLDRAVQEVMLGAFTTAGQRHNSTGRVIVHRAVYEAFVEVLVSRSAALQVGYGFDPDSFIGPLISSKLRERYRKYGRALASRGHNVLLAGNSLRSGERRGFYVSPSVYEINWRRGSAFMNEEPPGPTLLVYQVEDLDEAIALHNRATFRLVCSLFTQPSRLPAIFPRLDSGAVHYNRGTLFTAPRLPSVGLGRSGGGLPGGLELLDAVTYPRTCLGEGASDAISPELSPVQLPSDTLPPLEDADLTAALEPG
jgi:acyl-CoA reductase-like NAD-dependent aldehyde dehydrogenase